MDDRAYRELKEVVTARRAGDLKVLRLERADLSGLTARGVDLVGAQLGGADLSGSQLAGARLARASLRGANLRGADLANADLTDADLSGADLTGAIVDDTIFVSALLHEACLADLLGDPLSMAGARFDQKAIDRSGLNQKQVAHLMLWGVELDQTASIPPPSLPEAPQSGRSLVISLRPAEIASRKEFADQDEFQVPPSLRAFKELSALIEEAAIEARAPNSLRPQLSRAKMGELAHAALPKAGDLVLGVRLERELGQKTSSVTFIGQTESGEKVVLRLFNPSCQGAALAFPAFQRGVRALSRLQDAHSEGLAVARLISMAGDLSGYVVPYYESGSLLDLMSIEPSTESRLGAFRRVAEAVAKIHAEGLLVRSLKPENILIDGIDPVLAEIDLVDLPTLAQYHGDLGGYGAYSAPEEKLGIGTRSPTADVYALGKLLEYLLTGKEPLGLIAGESAIAQLDTIPQVLRQIVVRATQAEPLDRYQSVGELLADFERFSLDEEVPLPASIRPAEVSRLVPAPISILPPPPRQRPQPAPIAEVEEDRPAEGWLGRPLELGLASLGVLSLMGVLVVLFVVPSSIERLEGYVKFGAFLVGFSAWFLPVPRSKIVLKRLAAWATAAALFLLVDPLQVTVLRYRMDLRGSSAARKEVAVRHLARLGKRSFVGARLDGIDLSKTELASANFERASLAGTNFQFATLREARFSSAELKGAKFENADLRGTELGGAVDLEQARCSRWTRFPVGYICRGGFIRAREAGE